MRCGLFGIIRLGRVIVRLQLPDHGIPRLKVEWAVGQDRYKRKPPVFHRFDRDALDFNIHICNLCYLAEIYNRNL